MSFHRRWGYFHFINTIVITNLRKGQHSMESQPYIRLLLRLFPSSGIAGMVLTIFLPLWYPNVLNIFIIVSNLLCIIETIYLVNSWNWTLWIFIHISVKTKPNWRNHWLRTGLVFDSVQLRHDHNFPFSDAFSTVKAFRLFSLPQDKLHGGNFYRNSGLSWYAFFLFILSFIYWCILLCHLLS